MPRRREASDVGHLAACHQCKACRLRQTEHIFQPLPSDFFHDSSRRTTGINAGVLIPGRSKPVRCQCRGNHPTHHPREEAPAGVSEQAILGIAYEFFHHGLCRQALGVQRLRK